MPELHKLLKRQLKKYLELSEAPSGMESFIKAINDAYCQNDMDKMMVERSLEISSKELISTIDQLKQTQEELLSSKEQIRSIACHDSLTGLPNRYMLSNEIDDILKEVEKSKQGCAFLFIDMDDFKRINDAHGHSIGDEVLRLVAKRLNSCIGNNGRIYRYGGDEFLIILMNLNKQQVINTVTKMLKDFEGPFLINHLEIYTTPSVGVSFFMQDGDTAEELVRNADAAMCWAKDCGKNSYEIFSSKITELQNRRLKLEYAMKNALKNNEFVLYYQPQINMVTGKLWGLEALIRWNHQELGMLMPCEFIPIAEESGDIVKIGEWVVRTVCSKNKSLIDKDILNLPIAVNVSAVQLKQSDFAEVIEQNLRITGLDPRKLVVEFTESIMQDADKSFETVNKLKKLGVKVSIDDFGTGYSSLSLIKDLDIDQLKIDSSFVRDITRSSNTMDIIKLIIDIGKN